MSEINAIATNNYLLATQQEVSHDNTLSGNGTVDSPLGVVPGYNETVLYSGNIQYNATASLNEPAINFDRIRIYWAGENGSKSILVNEAQVLSGIDMLAIGGLYQRYSNNKWNFGGFSLSGNSDWSQIKMDATYRYNVSGNFMDYGLNANNFAYIKKIVGINRKA